MHMAIKQHYGEEESHRNGRISVASPVPDMLWGVSYSPMWFRELQRELLRHSKKTSTSTSWDMRKTRVLMNFLVCYSLWKSLGHDTSDKIRDHMNWKGLYSNSMVVNRSSNQAQGLGHWTALLHLPSHWTFSEINTGILNECFSHLMSSPYMTVPKVNYLNMEICFLLRTAASLKSVHSLVAN